MFRKDEMVRESSCSGGVFYALAEYTLNNGGVVCGCIWDDHYVAKHICTTNIEDVKKMRGSKYVQSDMGECFSEIKTYIDRGIRVLFCGTGCQTTALTNMIDKNRERLLTCAVVCGGVPSPAVWDYYIKAVEKQNGSRVKKLEMRSKKHGWIMPEIEIELDNRKNILEVLLQENLYGTNFGEGLFINDQCMKCKFKLNSVVADILLSDDWGITGKRLKKSKNKGSSAVIALTSRGNDYLNIIDEEMFTENGDISDIIKSHHVLTQNHIPNKYRSSFFENFDENNILSLLNENYQRWQNRVAMSPFVKLLYKFKIYSVVYVWKWKIKNRGGFLS